MSHASLFKVSTNTQDDTGYQCERKQLRPGTSVTKSITKLIR